MEEGPSKKITKRTRLTLAEQVEAARLLRSGKNAAEVMSQFSVSRRTVSNIKKKADDIIYQANQAGLSLQTKTVRTSQFPQIETEVYQFVTTSRALKFRITPATITERALLVRDRLLQAGPSSSEKDRIESFTATKGWVDNFIRRHALKSVSTSGDQDGVTPAETLAADMAVLCEKLRVYDIECIFNVNHTGLFYKLLPRRSYVYEHDHKKSVRGMRSMSPKDRITTYICTNPVGTKVPMTIIGKAENPRCFRIAKPPVPYLQQDNAWSDGVTFRRWFYDIFVPFIRTFTSKPVALLIDVCGPHGADLTDPKEQITIVTLPPNCTSVHQQMDMMDIITAWKKSYRELMLCEIERDAALRQGRRDESSSLRAGMKGLAEGFDPHMLDVANLIKTSWNQVSDMAIARSWIKAKFLPAAMEADLSASYGRMIDTSHSMDMRAVTVLLGSLFSSLDQRDPLYDQTLESLTEQDVNKWFSIEEDEDVRRAIVEDSLCSMDVGPAEDVPGQDMTAGEDSEEEETNNPARLPTMAQLMEQFRDLEDMAYNSNISDAISYLRVARRAFMDAKRKESSVSRSSR